jgi:hypothetical protein
MMEIVGMSLKLSHDISVDSPQEVTFDDNNSAKVYGLLQGAEGRKCVLTVKNNLVNPIVRVQPTWHMSVNPPAYVHSAVIENLIIDGKGYNNTGILLENVCNCQIRNITIRNCEVGIHIRNKWGLWSETNCLKHIRMENVKTGILFTTAGPYTSPTSQKTYPGASAGFTVIDDVGIKLANSSDAVGIQVGGKRIINDPDGKQDVITTVISPYSSRIRANVWLGTGGGTGLKIINGMLWYGQSHLTVHNVHNSANGIGIDLRDFTTPPPPPPPEQDTYRTYNTSYPNGVYRPIWENQFSTFNGVKPNNAVSNEGFMLVTSNIGSTNTVRKPPNVDMETDIITKTV